MSSQVGPSTQEKAKTKNSPRSNGLEPAPIEISSQALIEAKTIGKRIRQLRVKRSMGLTELERRSGLSASYLSQLETGRVFPTLRNLARISLVFEKDISYFFNEDKKNCFRISRARDRIGLPPEGRVNPFVICEGMSSIVPDQSIEPVLTHFLPGASDSFYSPEMFQGTEFLYVVQGSLALSIDSDEHLLVASDALWVDATAKRKYRCHGKVRATALILGVPK